MTWSLRIQHGDLALSGIKFDHVSGTAKLVQDLRCKIMERMGGDPYHPELGSTIDGGIREGRSVPSVIGETDWGLVRTQVEAEIYRICDDHRRSQLDRASSDMRIYGESTLSAAETLLGVSGIQTFQNQDVMIVNVSIRTAAGTTQELRIPVAENTGIM